MWNRLALWLTSYCLYKSDFSLEDRNEIVIHILDNLQALPLSSIIDTNDDGEILINGRSLDIEKAKQLRESARIALDSISLKVVNEQVLFIAITGGLHNATSPESLYFYRAAIWFSQQLKNQLNILAQRTEEPSLSTDL